MKHAVFAIQTTQAPGLITKTVSNSRGTLLVYLIVVLLIFGVLGVTLVSLFTTATTSSATPNDAKRARYLAESGIRYALSRIRNSNFNDNFIQSLNSLTHTLKDDKGSFEINVFSPGFEYTSNAGLVYTLTVPNGGKTPKNFAIPNVLAVNWRDFTGSPPPTTSYAQISDSPATGDELSFTITLDTNLATNTDDIICLAIQSTDAGPSDPLRPGDDIYVALGARDFFPPRNAAIRIVTSNGQHGDYYYRERIDEPDNYRVKLTGLAALPGTDPFDKITGFASDDWVVLSRYNYRLFATGKAGDAEVQVGDNKPLNIFGNAGVYTIYMEDLVADAEVNPSDLAKPLFDVVGGQDKKIVIGGSGPAFGDLWYGGEKSIGNDSNVCKEGRCLFGDGIRTFFTLDYSGTGEGLIFSLIAGGTEATPVNTRNSVGGDIEQSELLGYAGDSRTDKEGTAFADGTADGKGLLPPKIGLEFDTHTNFNQNFETNLAYCSDATSLKADTRNDPQPVGLDLPRDAMQNVFWGNTELEIPCRTDDATYDDNRHEAEGPTVKWTFATAGQVQSKAVIGQIDGRDDTLYVVTTSGHLHAIDIETGTEKWTFPASGSMGNVLTSPAINDDGNVVYVGARDNPSGDYKIWAIDTSDDAIDRKLWVFPDDDPEVSSIGKISESSPAVDAHGTIYVGSGFPNSGFYAIGSSGRQRWFYSTPGPCDSDPVVDRTPGGLYEGTVYITTDSFAGEDSKILAFDPLLEEPPLVAPKFEFNVSPNIPIKTGLALSEDGRFVYTVDTFGTVYRFDNSNITEPAKTFNTGFSSFNNIPAIDFSSGVANGPVYHVNDSGILYSITPDLSAQNWNISLNGAVKSSPALDQNDLNGTIYVGSFDNNLYAINPDKSIRWTMDLNGAVKSSPAIGADGTIYVGSDDGYVYAINRFAEPRNYRDNSVETKKLVISDPTNPAVAKWLTEGPWAVRMEVTRETRVTTIEGTDITEGIYVLKTWIEKCDGDCADFLDSLFRDTRVEYDVAARLNQTIVLIEADHLNFERFLFGFTTAAKNGDTQQATIQNFELSFIR